MKVELAVACVAGAVALISATITTWTSFRVAERSSAREGQRKVTKYSEPLVRSAYDLQSRFYNILGKRLFEAYRDGVDERAKNYIVDSTVFLICQYLCWTELVRREIQFVDTGNRSKTSQISHLQDAISAQWGTDSLGPKLRIFSVEQRAVGEALIQPGAKGRNAWATVLF